MVAGGHAVLEERADRLRMEPLDVIAFQEGVHDQLPVRRHVMRAAAEQMLAGEIERVEIMTERVCLGEIGMLVEREPDQAARLARRQALQAEAALVEAGEAVRPGRPANAPSSV